MFRVCCSMLHSMCVLQGSQGDRIPLIRTEYSQETLEFYVTFGFEKKRWQSWNLRRPVPGEAENQGFYLFKEQTHLYIIFLSYVRDPSHYFLGECFYCSSELQNKVYMDPVL